MLESVLRGRGEQGERKADSADISHLSFTSSKRNLKANVAVEEDPV